MRTWLGYTAQGVIRTTHWMQNAPGVDDGWPEVGSDPNDPQGDPQALFIVAECARDHPDVVGWYLYDCPCSGEAVGTCDCPYMRAQDSIYDEGSGELVTLPEASWLLDGLAQPSGTTPVPKAPGSQHTLRLVIAVSDATVIPLSSLAGGYVAEIAGGLPVNLVIGGGQSQEITVTTPPAGMKGGVRAHAEGICQLAALVLQGSL